MTTFIDGALVVEREIELEPPRRLSDFLKYHERLLVDGGIPADAELTWLTGKLAIRWRENLPVLPRVAEPETFPPLPPGADHWQAVDDMGAAV